MKKNCLWLKQWVFVVGVLLATLSMHTMMPKDAAG